MKHPVLANKVRLIVWWLVWLFLALGQSLLFYFAYGSFINISILDSVVSLTHLFRYCSCLCGILSDISIPE